MSHLVSFALEFFSPFSIAISFLYFCSICACLDLSVSSSSWCLGRVAVYDCGTPWNFLVLFLNSHCDSGVGRSLFGRVADCCGASVMFILFVCLLLCLVAHIALYSH